MAKLTKREITKRVEALTEVQAKAIVQAIAVDCVWSGRKMLNSSEILDAVCDVLDPSSYVRGKAVQCSVSIL